MEKTKKSKAKRIDFTTTDMVAILKIHEKLHMDVVILQEEYMKCQQSLFHEKWKFRHVARTLKQIAKKLGRPDLAVSEEELDKQIARKEN
jgi:hypothetical protein|tara:strand:- start:202 stop:471 length:270 start_codon:yes stop_codon:yes gene_type:complete